MNSNSATDASTFASIVVPSTSPQQPPYDTYSDAGVGSSESPTTNKVKVVAGYALQQKLGSGSFAVVYRGVRVSDEAAQRQLLPHHLQPPQQSPSPGETHTKSSPEAASVVAIKAISRTSEKLTKKVLQNLEIEINILRSYRHRNIVCMHDCHKTERHFYLLLEYCGGGDVQKLIRTRRKARLSERLARRLMRDLASGLRFLWGQELIHRVSRE
jgi:serine/threonine-protein kinase ULK/ATG1